VAGLMTALLLYMCSATVGKYECSYALSETYSNNLMGKKGGICLSEPPFAEHRDTAL